MNRWTILIIALLLGVSAVFGVSYSLITNKTASFAVVYSNDILGELDNCGCSEGQLGGLTRKAAVLDVIRWDMQHVVHVDAGNLFFGEKPRNDIERSQMLIKAEYIVKAYNTMGCDAINLGRTDLQLGLDTLKKLKEISSVPFVSSNIFSRTTGEPVFSRYRIFQVDGFRIAILGVCPPDIPHAETILIADPADAVRETLKAMGNQSDMVILLSACGMETDKKLAAMFPALRIIVSGNTGSESATGSIAADTAIVSSKKQGQYLGRLDVSAKQSFIRSELELTFKNSFVPLSDNLTAEPRIVAMVKEYNGQVNGMNKQALFKKKREESGQKIHADYTYTGADACAACHPAQYGNWLETAHAGAYKTLADKGRNFDTECLSCHTTGYGEPGGYEMSQADASSLLGVQCESCHGPGSNHKEKGTMLRAVGSDVCVSCHTEKHSPRFDYKEYVPLITCPSGH